MLAARFERFGGDVSIVTLPDPAPSADGVVIEVGATGVCRSDWHAWKGHDTDVSLPHVPGHEFAGTVVACGADVRSIAVGMRVVVPFVLGCGMCRYCRAGDAQICPEQLQPGFHLPGSFAEYAAIPRADFNLVPLPDAVSTQAAASLGCRYTTAWRALMQRGGLVAGSEVAIFGCGGVGLAATQIAVAHGAVVTAIDPSPAARARAAAAGANTEDLLPEDATFDLALDAIGHPAISTAALQALRPGGRLVQVGILEGTGNATIPLNRLMRHELAIVGSHGMAAAGFGELLDLVATARLDPQALITDRVTLQDGIDHLRHMPERSGKVVLIEGLGS